MTAPAVPLCLAFAAGIVAPSPASPAWALAIAAMTLAGALACAMRRDVRPGTLLAVVAFAALGSGASSIHARAIAGSELRLLYQRFGERAFSSPRLIEGTLELEPETRHDRTLLSVDVDSVQVGARVFPASGRMRVSVRGARRASLASMNAGDQVRFWALVREPAFFRNPGSFDGARILETRHIDLLGSVKSGLLVDRIAASASPLSWISQMRRLVLARLAAELDAPERGVVAALVTGVRTELSPELTRLYQRAGIFHVMAISGAHVGIWVGFVYLLGRRSGLRTRTLLVCLAVLLPVYAVFCGGRAPVVRAVLMALVWIGAGLASLRAPTGNTLATAALVLLAWEPASLFDAGFQLTMAAMTTIALFHERVAKRLAALGVLARPLAVSLAAQLGVIPIAAWHFHRLTPVSPLASLMAIPVAAAICVLGVVLVAVSGLPVVASAVSQATVAAVATLTGVAELASALPAASIRVGAPSSVVWVAYVVALAALVSNAKRWRIAGVVLVGVSLAAVIAPRRSSSGVLEVSALDVGHGDAIVVTLPEGGNVLIDGGGLPLTALDVGESVVLPFLLDRGVRRLDAVVVTHTDYDHIGGLATIVSELGVGEIWQGQPDAGRSAYRWLLERADEHGVPVRTLVAGESFELGGAGFEVLAAGQDASEPNNRSLVLRVRYAGRSILFTGDAEAELERRLVQARLDLRADVLKLAHHGSRSSTSSAFLDAVDPELAIISARRTRWRPIPSALVLHRLRERGIEYARTDRNGTVTVRIHQDGRLELTTYLMTDDR